MKNIMKYKGYYGSIEFDEDELIFHGKLQFIPSLISYEGDSARDIKQAFEEAVDDYLQVCEERQITPDKPFKGTFNVRVGESRHEKAVLIAQKIGTSLNDFVKQALDHEFEKYAAI